MSGSSAGWGHRVSVMEYEGAQFSNRNNKLTHSTSPQLWSIAIGTGQSEPAIIATAFCGASFGSLASIGVTCRAWHAEWFPSVLLSLHIFLTQTDTPMRYTERATTCPFASIHQVHRADLVNVVIVFSLMTFSPRTMWSISNRSLVPAALIASRF